MLKTTFFVLTLISFAAAENITGRVLDVNTQQPLTGVNVIIEHENKGAATDTSGFFIIENLDAGSYNLRVEYLGYKPLLKSNVIVSPGRTTQLRLMLIRTVLKGEAVTATASYFDESRDAPISSHSMDFEEIRRSPGSALDIQRVMQALPAVVSGTDQNNEIIIRGGIPGENLFVMDNIEIPNPNHFGDQGAGGGPINMLNTYMIRKIDFYAGAFPARFGDKASSVMDISLRDGSNSFRGEGTLGMAGAGVLLEGGLPSGNGNYIVSARKSFLDLIISSTGLTAVPKYYNLQGRTSSKLSRKNTLVLNAIYGNDEIHIIEEGTGGYSRGAENVDYTGNQFAAGATLKTLWSNRLFSNTTLSSVRSNWLVDVWRNNHDTYFRNNSQESEHTIKSDFTWQPGKNLEMDWGASYKNTGFDHDLRADADTVFLYNAPGTDSTLFSIYPAWADNRNETSFKAASYAQLSWDFVKHFRLNTGARFDYFDYTGFNSISPRVGLTYSLNPKTSLSLAYGIHYQTPSYLELTSHPKNKSLKSKFTRQYVLGLEQRFGEDIRTTVELYYKNYRDVPLSKFLTTPDPFDSFGGEMVNKGSGYARGVEFFFQKKLTNHFSAIISYSHSLSKARDPRFGTDYDWDYDFRNVFTLITGYKARLYKKQWYRDLKEQTWYKFTAWLFPFGDEVEYSVKFRYLGGRPYTAPRYHPEFKRWLVEENQALNTSRYPLYSRLDLRIDRRFFFDNWSIVGFFDIMNIYGRENIWEYQYNDDGTTEDVLQFQVFPVGGVSLEF